MTWKHKLGPAGVNLGPALRIALSGRRMTPERILRHQDVFLRRLITHAYHNVPYYRRLFDRSGVAPRDIRTAADLRAIPITEKDDLRNAPLSDIVARGVDPGRLAAFRTSGSSGEPFTIRRTWLETRISGLLWVRARRQWGLRMTDSMAMVVGTRPGRRAQDRRFARRVLNAFGLSRRNYIDCCLPPEEILRTLRQHRPDAIGGYPSVLSLLAQAITKQDRRDIRPRIIVTGGEVLTPAMRRQISDAFGARVYDAYSSFELSVIAWECRDTGELHTCDDGVIVEVLKDGHPAARGEQGELVGTNLHAFAMPFIRYRQGDIVTKGSDRCACGQPFATVSRIEGRTTKYFPLPGGRLLHPFPIVECVLQCAPWVSRWQLVQERKDLIALHAVAFSRPSAEELERLEGAVRSVLGPGVAFHTILVPRIGPDPGGKFQQFRPLAQ